MRPKAWRWLLLAVLLPAAAAHAEEAPKVYVNQGAPLRVVVGIHKTGSPPQIEKKYIDASASKGGDYLTPLAVSSRTGGERTVFLTAEGKRLFDAYVAKDAEGRAEVAVQENPSMLSDWWNGIAEEGIGKT